MMLTATSVNGGTVHDLEVFVIFPLIVAAILGLLSFAGWIVRQLQSHSQALALVLHEVNPSDAPSLRDQLNALRLDVAVIKAQPTNHGNP